MRPQPGETTRAPDRRRDRPRLLTVAYVFLCMVVLLGAFGSRNNLLFWLVGMSIGAVLVHGLTAGPPMMRLRLGRVEMPDTVERGHPLRIRTTITSRNRWRVARAMRAEAWLVGPNGQCVVASTGVASIGPGETVDVLLEASPGVRGAYDLSHVCVWTVFPFGLTRKELRFEAAGRAMCVPESSGGLGSDRDRLQRLATKHEMEVQPAGIRDYTRGDPRRLIAWRATARAQKMLVRETESSRGRRLWLRLRSDQQPLRDREPGAESMLDRAAAVGRHASMLNYEIGVWHPESNTRVLGGRGDRWRLAMGELGDRRDVVSGPRPSPSDIVMDFDLQASSGGSADG